MLAGIFSRLRLEIFIETFRTASLTKCFITYILNQGANIVLMYGSFVIVRDKYCSYVRLFCNWIRYLVIMIILCLDNIRELQMFYITNYYPFMFLSVFHSHSVFSFCGTSKVYLQSNERAVFWFTERKSVWKQFLQPKVTI